MGIDNLFADGSLKRIEKSDERAEKSLEAAAKYLKDARLSLGAGAFSVSVLGSYSAAFHAARAVLFTDGVAERSHYAVCEYLREMHGSLDVNGLNMYRSLRHNVAYGLESESDEKEAEAALAFAEKFVSMVREYLKME